MSLKAGSDNLVDLRPEPLTRGTQQSWIIAARRTIAVDLRRSILQDELEQVSQADARLDAESGRKAGSPENIRKMISLYGKEDDLSSRRAAAGRAELLAIWRRGMGRFPRKCKLRGPSRYPVHSLYIPCTFPVHFAKA